MKASQRQQQKDDRRIPPPGHFVSNDHAADCSRFLAEVKECVRRRHEAGLGRVR